LCPESDRYDSYSVNKPNRCAQSQFATGLTNVQIKKGRFWVITRNMANYLSS